MAHDPCFPSTQKCDVGRNRRVTWHVVFHSNSEHASASRRTEWERVPRFIEAESSCNLRQTNELAGQFGLSGAEEET